MNTAFKAAALLGGAAVLAGAFGAHGLKALLSEQSLGVWRTAVLYQFFHALALLAISCVPQQKAWRLSVWAWVLGVLIFCGSLYALALGAPSKLGMITPIGGLALCVGWFNLLRFKLQ